MYSPIKFTLTCNACKEPAGFITVGPIESSISLINCPNCKEIEGTHEDISDEVIKDFNIKPCDTCKDFTSHPDEECEYCGETIDD